MRLRLRRILDRAAIAIAALALAAPVHAQSAYLELLLRDRLAALFHVFLRLPRFAVFGRFRVTPVRSAIQSLVSVGSPRSIGICQSLLAYMATRHPACGASASTTRPCVGACTRRTQYHRRDENQWL